ncbi:hypothetical protein A3D66_00265 [Candidatus Kaiserbacteria bacterium RIFCSPHIGHO2_02_FULL_50_9]|uniref:Uncharacterized protein n=1 Tax=Candidatus Kaiserbacteria bacterium RIFCSPLOWO2_01_FULL_51_21 TaxID=1798508 RepID=A0A1F6ECE8_9BACT|nr:MAG: hypothetical protein A2761_00350 [Candidatus Kaiserbacteria bacterium RIFCSPHIGHO2_01_FULL_51_33]OGG63528.1 MAG: hypothetical protein A3D66_00265 [Candidatus Kaiserbacteria bacterium RIFCSPHIGHO2_02_FULL_50_9]OGG71353.1 MAG: hypothetical protein A3A35_00080 [Candidatus Kaiserbacteria bacterium RIFCSPLOWO2_01_FULL_51_21]
MEWENRRLLRFALLIITGLGMAGYALFEARFLIQGPVVTIDTPRNGQSVSVPLVEIAGKAKNISDITLNDRKIFVDEQGYFHEQLLLFYGYNILTLTAHDRFGRETQKVLELVYQ